MKTLIPILCLLFLCACSSSKKTSSTIAIPENYQEAIQKVQNQLTQDYLSEEDSPLKKKERELFKAKGGHPFFPINEEYKVEAKLEVYENPDATEFKTSTSRLAKYNIYGKVSFKLNGKDFEAYVYQSLRLMNDEEYKDYLFFPFTDLTNGETTYGGGRYIDMRIPKDKSKITIDFNTCYQPYCAYTTGYSCPVPPEGNFFDTKIEAGIKHLDLK